MMAPFLDVMMSLECSSKVKSIDRSLFTLHKVDLGGHWTTQSAPRSSE